MDKVCVHRWVIESHETADPELDYFNSVCKNCGEYKEYPKEHKELSTAWRSQAAALKDLGSQGIFVNERNYKPYG